MKMYTSELLVVTNKDTGKQQYYVQKCDTFQRVSKAEYDERYQAADGISCLFTKSTLTHVRSYRTMTYEVNDK